MELLSILYLCQFVSPRQTIARHQKSPAYIRLGLFSMYRRQETSTDATDVTDGNRPNRPNRRRQTATDPTDGNRPNRPAQTQQTSTDPTDPTILLLGIPNTCCLGQTLEGCAKPREGRPNLACLEKPYEFWTLLGAKSLDLAWCKKFGPCLC